MYKENDIVEIKDKTGHLYDSSHCKAKILKFCGQFVIFEVLSFYDCEDIFYPIGEVRATTKNSILQKL